MGTPHTATGLKKGTKTVTALMQRGFDSELAKKLARAGETLSSLKQKTEEQLLGLEIPEHLVKEIRTESRPPIPESTMSKLLLESAWACNVCSKSDVSLIVHHINEWADSRSHDESNLIVLCLNHHGEAHTKRELGQNLTPNRLREAKANWTAHVLREKAKSILRPTNILTNEFWDYFNHGRLVQYAQGAGMPLTQQPAYQTLLQYGLIEDDGTPRLPENSNVAAHYFLYEVYGGGNTGRSGTVYRFYRWIIEELLRNIFWIDLTTNWGRQRIKNLATPGALVVCRGPHIFKQLGDPQKQGPNQMRKVRRKKDKIELSFMIDAWESTSSSSHWGHLTRRSSVMSVSVIRSLEENAGVLSMSATCLGIGTGFGPYLMSDCPYDGHYIDAPEDEDGPPPELDDI